MAEAGDTFVVRTGRLRALVVGTALVFLAVYFLFMIVVWIYIGIVFDDAAMWIFSMTLVLCAAALAAYMLLQLYTLAVWIEVGRARVKLRVPRMRGHLPLPGMIRANLAYDAIASVQGRSEIYVTFGHEQLQYAYSLVTRDGDRVPLGLVVPGAAMQYPFGEVAREIAERAACPLIESGRVRIKGILRGMIYGTPDWSAS